jgi:uncharacterized protein with HEPN domain
MSVLLRRPMLSMPSKSFDPRKALLHIRDNIHLARTFVDDLDHEAFRDNQLVFYAVTRALEIISEASRRLPDDMKARHPDIPWNEMAGAGNIYRHDYEDVRQSLVWGTVHTRFPALLMVVEQELARLGELS